MKTWDPTRFIITIGAINAVDFAKGGFIKAMYNEDAYSLQIGADGFGARIRNANESGRFEITLQKSSPTNDLLSAQALLDRQTGQGVVPVQVKDLNGTSVALGQNTWITKVPDLERGAELGDVTWILETDRLKMTEGGMSG